MSKSGEEGKKVPEWSIFDRIEELEKITLELMGKTDEAEPTLKDTANLARTAFGIGWVGFMLGFIAATRNIEKRRKFKDDWVTYMKEQNLDQKTIDFIHEWMNAICNWYEEVER